jgi:hypothetical protein
LRETLRKFGIPEDKVHAIKQRGTKTWFKLARDKEEEAKLRAEVKEHEEINTIELTVQKILRKAISRDEASKVDCWILELEKGDIMIHTTKPTAMTQESFRKMWESRGFKVEDFGTTYARKAVTLSLRSNKDKLSSEIKQCLGMNN